MHPMYLFKWFCWINLYCEDNFCILCYVFGILCTKCFFLVSRSWMFLMLKITMYKSECAIFLTLEMMTCWGPTPKFQQFTIWSGAECCTCRIHGWSISLSDSHLCMEEPHSHRSSRFEYHRHQYFDTFLMLYSFLNHLFRALIKGAFCAMSGFSDREENCSDFLFCHCFVIRCDTFSLQKRKKKWTIIFDREDFYFLLEG